MRPTPPYTERPTLVPRRAGMDHGLGEGATAPLIRSFASKRDMSEIGNDTRPKKMHMAWHGHQEGTHRRRFDSHPPLQPRRSSCTTCDDSPTTFTRCNSRVPEIFEDSVFRCTVPVHRLISRRVKHGPAESERIQLDATAKTRPGMPKPGGHSTMMKTFLNLVTDHASYSRTLIYNVDVTSYIYIYIYI